MNYFRRLQNKICAVLVVAIFGTAVQATAFAGVVSTTDIVDAQQVQQERNRLHDWMARDDVREQLTAQGVNIDDAVARVDAMTDEEVMLMAAKMDEMPAGSGTLELVVIGALVLVILELSGVTDLFTFI